MAYLTHKALHIPHEHIQCAPNAIAYVCGYVRHFGLVYICVQGDSYDSCVCHNYEQIEESRCSNFFQSFSCERK